MAKKFVNVKGLHNVFASETALANNTILNDVSTIVDQNSVLYITADTTDETTFPNYKIHNGDNVVYAKGKLVGNYLGNSLKSLTNTAATLSINDNYDVYFITNTHNGAVTLTFALSNATANANKSLNIMAIIKNDNSAAITINLAADSNFNVVNNLYSSNSFLLGAGEVAEIYYNEIKNGNGVAYLSFGVNKSDEAINLINRIELNGTALPVNNSSVNIPLAARNVTGVVKTTSTTTSTTGLIATPIISGVPYYKDTVYTHPGKTLTDTTSSATPAHGGTFSVVDSVTRDSSGHVSGINIKTVTLPTVSGSTDEKQKVTATTSGTFYLSGVGTTSNTPAVGVADATIKVVNRVLTATSASLTNATVSTMTVSTINGVASPVFTDEKIKVSTSTTDARFPLMAVATSSITSGNIYQAIYDSGIVINPSIHSVAEGIDTIASGLLSHASGYYTIADQMYETVIGKYNSTATASNIGGDYLFVVGNGTASATASRSNAFTVTTNGATANRIQIAGGPYQNLSGNPDIGGLYFGDEDNCYIKEWINGSNIDTDSMLLHIGNSDNGFHFELDSEIVHLHTNNNRVTLNHERNSYNSFVISSDTDCAQLELNGDACWAKLSADNDNAYITVDGDGNVLGGDGGIRLDTTICNGDVSILTGSGVVKISNKVEAINGFFQTSDKRQKNIISDLSLEKVYDLIDKCQTIIYTLKDDESNKEQIGMIAQEIQEFFPEVISEDKDGMLSLDYSRLTVIIFKVLKDLIKRIEKLEQKLN